MYFTNKILIDSKSRYNGFEKLTFSLRVAAKKLQPYLQAHQITVLMTYAIKAVLEKHDISGRLLKWEIELKEYGIQFKPRIAVKAQALANFVTKLGPARSLENIEGWW